MIGYLKGIFECSAGPDSCIIMVSGVGYEVSVGATFLEANQVGDPVNLWVYTHVKEDALSLYGFESKEEKDFFKTLISVNGIGPKSALGILSLHNWESIVSWIKVGDTKSLTTLPKVGKKTAEMLIINLKDKFERLETSKSIVNVKTESQSPLFSVLKNLGFAEEEIREVSQKIDLEKTIEEQVRDSLTLLR